jgi:hypothetical protein
MGVGPNYGLDKGFLVEGATAVVYGRVAIPGTAEQSAVTPSATSTTVVPLGIWQENVDTTRVATGKVIANVRLNGLTRAEAGAAITKGDRLTWDNQGRVVSQARTAAGSQPVVILGVAENAATAAGQHIDVDLAQRGTTY